MSQPLFTAFALIGLRFDSGDVTGTGSHDQFASAPCGGSHSNRTMGTVPCGVSGNVSDGVLIANVPGDVSANSDDIVKMLRKECFATSCLRQAFEHIRVLVWILWVEDPNGVHK